MDEVLDDPGPRQRLEVRARLAELDAVALDLPDAEALADQIVQPDAPYGELPPRPAGRQSHVVDRLGLDERERLARQRALGMELPVTLEPVPGDGACLLHHPELARDLAADVNRLHHGTDHTHRPRRRRSPPPL